MVDPGFLVLDLLSLSAAWRLPVRFMSICLPVYIVVSAPFTISLYELAFCPLASRSLRLFYMQADIK